MDLEGLLCGSRFQRLMRMAPALTLVAVPARGMCEPGRRVLQAKFERRPFVLCEKIGDVTGIALGRVARDELDHVILAGPRGYALVHPETRAITRSVSFEPTLPYEDRVPVRIVDADGDGLFEFLRAAAYWRGRTSLHDPSGKALWVHPGKPADKSDMPGVNFTCYGDVDGDGKLEFLMGFNATETVHLLDHEGHVVLEQDWSAHLLGDSLVLHDVDGNGTQDFLYVDFHALWVRDHQGQVLVCTPWDGANSLERIQGYGNPPRDQLVLGRWAGEGEAGHQEFHLVAPDAKTVGERIDGEELARHQPATPFRLKDMAQTFYARTDDIKQQAPVAGFSATCLSVHILDESKALVFQELITPPNAEVADQDGVLEFLDGGGEHGRLLVAYGAQVWEYTRR